MTPLAIAVYDYAATQDDELTFAENDELYILEQTDDGWCKGMRVEDPAVRGAFPGNYVEMQ